MKTPSESTVAATEATESSSAPENAPANEALEANGAEQHTLQTELEAARQAVAETEKSLIYLQAEFQNFRRRQKEENAALQKFATIELVRELLPVLDNFERALAAAEQARSFDALVGGVSGTLKQLQSLLEKAGVRPIQAVGSEFDPQYHEAIGQTEPGELPPNTVAEEVQRGYMLHDRVLRPALVKVAG